MEAYYKKGFRFEKNKGLPTMFYFPLPSFYVINVKNEYRGKDKTSIRIRKIDRSLKNLVSGVRY
jgi:hypothetical protein